MELTRSDGALWDLVRSVMRAHPEATAIIDGDARITYRDLAQEVEALSQTLSAEYGVTEESVVALALPRSHRLIATELAVVRCGGAFMPLDPDEPATRRDYMLADSRAAVLVHEDGIVALQPPDCAERDAGHVDPAAYVLYTSGSTGVPKGVVIERQAIAGYLGFVIDHYELTPADVQVQFSSPGFDISIEEIFSTLCAGATVLVRDRGPMQQLATLLAWARAHEVTVLNLPTGAWREFGNELRRDPALRLPRSIRLVVVGGEQAETETVDAWHAAADAPLRIINAYGPTEATISVCMGDLRPGERVTIGRPVRGVDVFPADAELQRLAPGSPGELCVEGPALARGYIGDSELTEQRFARIDGRRLYRTGDVGRLLPDGRIEFLGRDDDQVKVRGGFRVEPGEVRAAILGDPRVADAFVELVRRGSARQLVAFVVVDGDGPDERELRERLSGMLPAFMVPSAFAFVATLPLTSRGKIDRAALHIHPETVGAEAAPAAGDGLEDLRAAVHGAWAEVLGVPPADDDESFFEVGGDSLGAVQLLVIVGEALDARIELRAFLTDPTPRGLLSELVVDPDAAPDVHHTTGRVVVRLRRRGAGVLWCFMPPLSGAVTRYASMARLLPLGDAVWACETPAHLAARGLHGIADGLTPALIAEGACDFEAIAFAGYSLGGVIALEVARRFRESPAGAGKAVDVLMLDPPPPGLPLATTAETLEIFVNIGWRAEADSAQFLRADGSVDVAGIADAARAAGTLPPAASDDEIADSWIVYSHNATMLEGYEPQPLPGQAPALLRSMGQPGGAPVRWTAAIAPGEWSSIVRDDRCAHVEIDHFGLMEAPTDAVVARWLAATRATPSVRADGSVPAGG